MSWSAASARSGTCAELRVQTILVDNASTDATVPWVRDSHPSVDLVELPENVGMAARDHGLSRARAQLTMFLDSDAALTPGALPAMVEAMEHNPEWGLIGPRLVATTGACSSRAAAFRRRSFHSSAGPRCPHWGRTRPRFGGI